MLLDDVRLALEGRTPVEFYGRSGGNVPSAEEVFDFVRKRAERLRGATPRLEEVACG